MDARHVMTRTVHTVHPDCSTKDIARLLLDQAISAVPVVENGGAPIGMVSEGDLLRRSHDERRARRDWWLEMLAEGDPLAKPFLDHVDAASETARHLMTAPVVTVTESTPVDAIARLLETHRIKRVPVVRDGLIVGIVSRADLVRALAQFPQPGHSGLFAHDRRGDARIAPSIPPATEPKISARDFASLAAGHDHEKERRQHEARERAASLRKEQVSTLLDHHVADTVWNDLLHRARLAAEQGEKEFLLLRFPCDLCSDGGRAINAPDPDWPKSLRGEAADMFLRWDGELRPMGFGLTARVLDFPGGFPGDVGLYLTWHE